MFRFVNYLARYFIFVLKQLGQAIQIMRRIAYILLLIVSSFLVQLHICLYLADSFDIVEITSVSGFYPLSDWSQHAERFLICCGAFLWLIYILPNRKGVSPWAKGVWATWPPILVAALHFAFWVLLWGPLAKMSALYQGMSTTGAVACALTLAELYYVQVWQDIVHHIIKTQKIRAERLRFVEKNHTNKERVSSYL